MQDAARKGREPADRSGKGRRRRGPLKSQREKRCFFFFKHFICFQYSQLPWSERNSSQVGLNHKENSLA